MSDKQKIKIDVGFEGGQTLALKVTEVEYEGLLAGVEKGAGWHKFTADDGEFSVDASKVAYVKRELEDQRVGF